MMRIKRKVFSRTGYPLDANRQEIERPRWELRNPKNLKIIYNIIFSNSYSKDRSKIILQEDKRRIKKLISSLRSGNIYDNDPNDNTEYTHYIGKSSGSLTYSKDISPIDRLVYEIGKPKIYHIDEDNEDVIVINVLVVACREHKRKINGKLTNYSNITE